MSHMFPSEPELWPLRRGQGKSRGQPRSDRLRATFVSRTSLRIILLVTPSKDCIQSKAQVLAPRPRATLSPSERGRTRSARSEPLLAGLWLSRAGRPRGSVVLAGPLPGGTARANADVPSLPGSTVNMWTWTGANWGL